MATIADDKFAESDFTGKGASSLPDRPKDAGLDGTAVKERLDQIGKLLIALGKHNSLIDRLLGTTAGESGADNIGSASISGVTGTTVWAQISDLKTQLAAAIIGTFSGGSISTSMLADGAVTKAKLAENPSKVTSITVTASKTLSATDLDVIQNCTHATVAIALTVPTGLWQHGIPIPVKRGGAADASVVAGSGVTINQTKLKIASQGDYAALIPTETSETYDFVGSTKA